MPPFFKMSDTSGWKDAAYLLYDDSLSCSGLFARLGGLHQGKKFLLNFSAGLRVVFCAPQILSCVSVRGSCLGRIFVLVVLLDTGSSAFFLAVAAIEHS